MNRAEEHAVCDLHHTLLNAWNRRHADAYAALFLADGYVVGFDGSQMEGREEIALQLGAIFADHVTATYVGIIEDVRFLAPDVALLRASAGMIPSGQTDIFPEVNALQTMVAVKRGDHWRIAHFQNTPAQFHGRPELVERMTNRLRQVPRNDIE